MNNLTSLEYDLDNCLRINFKRFPAIPLCSEICFGEGGLRLLSIFLHFKDHWKHELLPLPSWATAVRGIRAMVLPKLLMRWWEKRSSLSSCSLNTLPCHSCWASWRPYFPANYGFVYLSDSGEGDWGTDSLGPLGADVSMDLCVVPCFRSYFLFICNFPHISLLASASLATEIQQFASFHWYVCSWNVDSIGLGKKGEDRIS